MTTKQVRQIGSLIISLAAFVLLFDGSNAFLATTGVVLPERPGLKRRDAEPSSFDYRPPVHGSVPPPAKYPKQLQIRKKPRQRRPRRYWQSIENIDRELRELWAFANVTISRRAPPPIPNETLLNYWKRNDLRAAIVTYGGRKELSECLKGSMIVPGKWNEAVKTPIVKQVVAHDPNLSLEQPPLSPQQLRSKSIESSKSSASLSSRNISTSALKEAEKDKSPKRWQHREGRKPFGYWSSADLVIGELYRYLEERCLKENMPRTWMPRMSALIIDGREDLKGAIHRFGGCTRICQRAGLIPFREWNYIEGLHELMLRLREYLDRYHDGNYRQMPMATQIQGRNYDRLYALIQYYGGVHFVAARLGMVRSSSATPNQDLLSAGLNFGPFDLDFGIQLLDVVRNQELQKKPPLDNAEIVIPSRQTLLSYGHQGQRLDKKIQEYGGYENVARRLGLGFSFR